MVNKIDHIGIAVESIENSLPFYTDVLKLEFLGSEEVESEGVKVAFVKVGETNFELLEPLHENSPIAKFIKKYGEGIHHIALNVESIEKRIEEIKSKGIQMINEQAKEGAHGALIAFIHPKSTGGVLFEMCEKRGEEEK